MKKIELFNLHIGCARPPSEWCVSTIGPFTVKLVDSYKCRVSRLYQRKSRVDGQVRQQQGGGWQVTATAEYDENSSTENSILLRRNGSDYGLWDLCTILTFLTGRRVVTAEYRDMYSPDMHWERACLDVETLRAASIAWCHRAKLADNGLVWALLYYNEALSHNSVPVLAALYTTSLDLLQNTSIEEGPEVDKQTRNKLRAKIKEVIHSCDFLSQGQKNAYKAIVGARISQGTNTSRVKLKNLLVNYRIVNEPIGDDVNTRIGYVNSVRNKLVHTGLIPCLNPTELSQEQSDDYSFNIVGNIIPALCRLVIGKRFGFSEGSLGSLCQHTHDLKQFFNDGSLPVGI